MSGNLQNTIIYPWLVELSPPFHPQFTPPASFPECLGEPSCETWRAFPSRCLPSFFSGTFVPLGLLPRAYSPLFSTNELGFFSYWGNRWNDELPFVSVQVSACLVEIYDLEVQSWRPKQHNNRVKATTPTESYPGTSSSLADISSEGSNASCETAHFEVIKPSSLSFFLSLSLGDTWNFRILLANKDKWAWERKFPSYFEARNETTKRKDWREIPWVKSFRKNRIFFSKHVTEKEKASHGSFRVRD